MTEEWSAVPGFEGLYEIRAIKKALHDGEKGSVLSKRFGVAQSTVSAIKHGKFHTDV